MNNPLISVIIPVCNVEKYLTKCLNSVIAQTYKNLEIILIDDGSIDTSGKICDKYAIKDKRVLVIHKTNRNVAATRNVGLEMAHGEYITFVDSDDYLEPDMYEYLYNLVIKDKAAFSMCNVCSDEGYYSKMQIKQPYQLITITEIFQFNIWVYLWNKLYRKDFISRLRFNTTTTTGSDTLFNFELAKSKASVALGNQPKYHYRINQNPNTLTKKFQATHLNFIKLTEESLIYAKEHNLTMYWQKSSKAQIFHVFKWLVQIAYSNVSDPSSVKFLTEYIKTHFRQFLSSQISWKEKLFVICACINFNLTRKILLFYYFRIKRT